MTIEAAIAEAVRLAVREEVAPLREEVARLRAERQAEAVTPTEAARRLGVSVRTVRRMITRGELPSVKIGGARRVRLASVLPDETLPTAAKTG